MLKWLACIGLVLGDTAGERFQEQYPIRPDEEQQIHFLLHTMAEGYWAALFAKNDLDRISRELDHIHPLRFMAYTLMEPQLRDYLFKIRKKNAIWHKLEERFEQGMHKEALNNNLAKHFLAFQELTGTDLAHNPYVAQGDWKRVLAALIDA